MPKNEDVITAPFENVKNFDYTMVDLFSGIGGTRLGFHQTGRVASIFSSEINKYSIETYKANFNSVPKGDITKIQVDDIPDFDILVAGFPCQAFSQAGKKLGFEDTRGTLFFEIARILEGKRPKAFLLENVKNLIKHNDGKTFNVIMETLRGLDYEVYYSLLKAKDFGVPQNRERIYIVGFKDKLKWEKFVFPGEIPLTTPLNEIIDFGTKMDDKYYYTKGKFKGDIYDRLIKAMDDPNAVYQWRRKYVRKNKSGVIPTLTANQGEGGHNVCLVKTKHGIRKMTPKECFNAQGFPLDFKLPDKMSDSRLYKQAGNSVCVSVIERIAEEIAKVMEI